MVAVTLYNSDKLKEHKSKKSAGNEGMQIPKSMMFHALNASSISLEKAGIYFRWTVPH